MGEDRDAELPLYGYIHLDGWSGRSQQLVMYVADTPKRVRVRAVNRTRLAGRGRWLEPGEEALVPHESFSFGAKPDVDIVKF